MGSSEKVVVIGLWGFPGLWYRARYRVAIPKRGKLSRYVSWELDEIRVSSHTSTYVMAKRFMERGFDVSIAIYGLDTLAAPSRVRTDRDGDELRRRLGEKLNVRIEEFLNKDPVEYENIVERAKEVLNLYAKGYAEELGEDIRNHIKCIDILPGVGTYALGGYRDRHKVYRFSGSPLNTYASLYLRCLDLLMDVDPELVVLDISHGVNYLPTLGYNAVIRAVKTFSALCMKEVILAVMNSDPVNRDDQEADIHLVELERVKMDPLNMFSTLKDTQCEDCVKMLERRRKPAEVEVLQNRISKIANSYLGLINALSNISNYGFMLYMIYKLLEVDLGSLKESIEKLREALTASLSYREVYIANNEIIVNQPYVITEDALNLYDLVLVLQHVVENTRKCIECLTINGKKWIPLDSLKDLSKRIGLSRIAQVIFEKELYTIEHSVELLRKAGLDFSQPIRLNKLMSLLECRAMDVLDEEKRRVIEQSVRITCEVDRRNFYAHAGLERNVVEILVKHSRIYARYADECIETVEKIIRETQS